ncbi:MAG: glucokinase [Geminocystis sp.]|nr:glucokinase [Geminocystis sp.]MDW8462941.1 glucokinase [Geminocystis sp.]
MRVLAGDVGGTNAILCLLEIDPKTQNINPVKKQKYASKQYKRFSDILEDFLGVETADYASIAVAGPVENNSSTITNLSWKIVGEKLEREFKFKKAYLLNDFAAVSYGILTLNEEELYLLKEGKKEGQEEEEKKGADREYPIAVVGAGTGLGESFLVKVKGEYQVFATEGGHTDFAPRNEIEWQLMHYLKHKFDLERVSVERVVSGQGIVAIYQFLRDNNWAQESPEIGERIRRWEEGDESIDPGAVIGESALKKNDLLSSKAISIFLSAYGAEVGNFALKTLPYSGIYIAGGIAPKLLPLIPESEFLKSFLDKGRMKPVLEKITVKIVTNPEVGLKGSIYHLLANLKNPSTTSL